MIQRLGSATPKQGAKLLFKEVLKVHNPTKLFNEEVMIATLSTMFVLMSKQKRGEPEDNKEYKLPRFPDNTIDLLSIPVKSFIEMINADIKEDFTNYEILCGCLWRKDWSKPINDNEIIETALHFREQPFIYALWAAELMNKTTKTLQETYPILYEGGEESKSEGRRLVDLVDGLAQNDVTKWEAVENITLKRAFTYLEQCKIRALNEKKEEFARKHRR